MNHIPNGLSRRGVLGVAAGSALTAMLAACSNDSSSSKSSTSGTASSGAAAAGKFPQTVPSIYGKVTLSERPKKVVSLDGALADMCVALGVQPEVVAADSKELSPWFKGRFTGELDAAMVGDSGPSLERIASRKPDLVLGGQYDIDKDFYPRVSKVAATYATRGEGTGAWIDRLQDISLLLTGASTKGSEVKKGVDDMMAQYSAKVPGVQGKKYQWVAASVGNITFGDGSFLEMLGLVPGTHQDGKTQTHLAFENMDQLDADVLGVFAPLPAARKKLEGDPRFTQLAASKNGTVFWVTLDQANALQGPCPSSFKWLADWIVPVLAKSKLNTAG